MTDRVINYEVFAPKTRANPQAIYEQLRQNAPIYCEVGPMTGMNIWFLTRYDDAVWGLKDPRIGKEVRKHMPPELRQKFGEPTGFLAAIDRHMLNLDPPDHTRLRALVHKAFTPSIIENLRPRIHQIADELLNKAGTDRAMDIIADYGFPLPITVIAELLGIPAENRHQFRNWTRQLLFGRVESEVVTAAMEFVTYMGNLIEERQAYPQQDLLSNLALVHEQGDKLDRQELLSMIFLLLVAGHETTVNLIGNGTLALLQHPEQLRKLQEHPDLINSAVEEMLRYNGPVETSTTRFAFEDIEIRGTMIPQGDMVLSSLLGANRDPEIFENPNTFDITRNPNKHIAFGNGIHYCLGAPLARLEGAIAINTLLRRLPKLNIQPNTIESLEWTDSILIHGLRALPVQF